MSCSAARGGDAGPIVTAFSRAALHAVVNGERLAARVAEVQTGWRERVVARADSAIWKVIDILPAHPVADAEGLAHAVGGDSRNIHRRIRILTTAGILVESVKPTNIAAVITIKMQASYESRADSCDFYRPADGRQVTIALV